MENLSVLSYSFTFRKATTNDISSLESCRVKSIESCKIYSAKQLDIWKKSKPNWKAIIPNTIVCLNKKLVVGFVVSDQNFLDYLYVHPNYQKQGIANQLVSLVEKTNMKCDCNPYSEKILKSRGWIFLSDNLKEKSGVKFHNKWYIFDKT